MGLFDIKACFVMTALKAIAEKNDHIVSTKDFCCRVLHKLRNQILLVPFDSMVPYSYMPEKFLVPLEDISLCREVVAKNGFPSSSTFVVAIKLCGKTGPKTIQRVGSSSRPTVTLR